MSEHVKRKPRELVLKKKNYENAIYKKHFNVEQPKRKQQEHQKNLQKLEKKHDVVNSKTITLSSEEAYQLNKKPKKQKDIADIDDNASDNDNTSNNDSESDTDDNKDYYNLKDTDDNNKSNNKKARPFISGAHVNDDETLQRGVVLVNRLPRGFHEPQLKKFFSQFGEVNRLRLIRSKKTTNSKGYGFIEFTSREVAQIVAETMNKYMMFGNVLKARLLSPENVPAGLFTKYKRNLKLNKGVDAHRNRINNLSNQPIDAKRVQRALKKEEKRANKLKELGIQFTPTLSVSNILTKKNNNLQIPSKKIHKKKTIDN